MTKSVFYSQVEDEELYVEIGEVDKDGEFFFVGDCSCRRGRGYGSQYHNSEHDKYNVISEVEL